MKKIILTTLCCLTAALTSAREKSPVTIIMQVSDPQMGFYADNRDMAYETRTLTKTVEAINRLRPDVWKRVPSMWNPTRNTSEPTASVCV